MKRIGIVAALPEEAEAFFAGQGSVENAIRHVVANDSEIFIATSGIGKVNAAIAATSLVERYQVQLLAITGTAGALGDDHGTFLIQEAVQCDYGAWRPQEFAHFRAGDWPIGPAVWTPLEAMTVESVLPRARIATSDAFVECRDRARYLRETLGCSLIDMETGAVAQVAAHLGVPWIAIKATTDGADGASAGDFTANLKRAATAAADALETLLRTV